jgi:ribosome-binding protein aMBF1 (putative translation factor)
MISPSVERTLRYDRASMGQEGGRRPKLDPESRAPDAAQDEHQAFNAVVGEGIRKARQEHGWTQAFLAEQARLSPNYIARLERGELGPSLFVANRICEALAIDLEVLVGPPSDGATRRTARRKAG